MSIYADTSFFVSLYLSDRHSSEAERRLAARPFIWITPFHVAEWTHAIEQHLFRKEISRREADRLTHEFNQHCTQGIWREVAFPDRAWEVCTQLANQYAAKLGVRTLDTLHVASALELKAERFWAFDQQQEKLAAVVGLKII